MDEYKQDIDNLLTQINDYVDPLLKDIYYSYVIKRDASGQWENEPKWESIFGTDRNFIANLLNTVDSLDGLAPLKQILGENSKFKNYKDFRSTILRKAFFRGGKEELEKIAISFTAGTLAYLQSSKSKMNHSDFCSIEAMVYKVDSDVKGLKLKEMDEQKRMEELKKNPPKGGGGFGGFLL